MSERSSPALLLRTLRRFARELHRGGLARRLQGEDALEAAMARLGLVELIGTDNFYGTVTFAVESVVRHDPDG